MPQRIQRRRTKGWRKPDNSVCVTRPGTFGNPFRTAAAFEIWMRTGEVQFDQLIDGSDQQRMDARRAVVQKRLPELHGKDLACFCELSADCHADVLLRLANEQ